MGWSFHIVRVGGIDVKVHVTFLLFLGWIAYMYGRAGGLPAAFEGVLFVSLIFLCVLLHEFGHALAARRYGIATPEITLLPIGGVARLERMPEKPIEEIVVAIAGPAVNVVIAALLWGFVVLTGGFRDSGLLHAGLDLPVKLLGVNLWLVIFNLIPAFPMDGGRVLRALLALRINYSKATSMAAGVGQMIACVFGILGLVGNPMLVLIALFVYFGAASEASLAQFKSFSQGLRASAAMLTHFHTLPIHATVKEALEVVVHSAEHAFPVVDLQGRVRGMLTREDIISALRQFGAHTALAGIMRMDVPLIPHTMPFERAFALLQEANCPALPIVDSTERLIGLFTPEAVKDLMSIQNALQGAPQQEVLSEMPPPLPSNNHRLN